MVDDKWHDGWPPEGLACVMWQQLWSAPSPQETGVWSRLVHWTWGLLLVQRACAAVLISSVTSSVFCYHGCHTVSLADHPPHTQDNSQAWVSLPAPAWYATLCFRLEHFSAWSLKLWSTAALIISSSISFALAAILFLRETTGFKYNHGVSVTMICISFENYCLQSSKYEECGNTSSQKLNPVSFCGLLLLCRAKIRLAVM